MAGTEEQEWANLLAEIFDKTYTETRLNYLSF